MTDTEDIRAALDAAGSRAEARAYLDGLGLTKAGLREVAEGLGLAVSSGQGKADLARAIAEQTAGARLDAKAIRGKSWGKRF